MPVSLADHPDLLSQHACGNPHDALLTLKSYHLWRCPSGHDFCQRLEHRIGGIGCGVCAGKQIVHGVNDLETRFPDVARDWHPDNERLSHEVAPNSNRRVKWRCMFGHEWVQSPNIRVSQGTGCPMCSGRVVVSGVNDLATTHPVLAGELIEEHRSLASSVSAGSARKLTWLCRGGHVWDAALFIRKKGVGCPYCAGNRVVPGESDVGTRYPEVAACMQQGGDRLLSPSSTIVVSWRCVECFREYRSSVRHRVRRWRNSGSLQCRECAAVSVRGSSRGERELGDFVESICEGFHVVQNDRTLIAPKELDVYVPSLRVAFEFNGTYWHSDERIRRTLGISAEEYHENKTSLCREAGVKLIHVAQRDWENHRSNCHALVEAALSESVSSSSNSRSEKR